MEMRAPHSPNDEIDGIIYFRRLCDKIRLHQAGALPEDYHANLGRGMDLWTCEFLGVDYDDLAAVVRDGADDEAALAWAKANGVGRLECERRWWTDFMKTRGFRDELSERLESRKVESGFGGRDDIQTFMDYIDADEGRI